MHTNMTGGSSDRPQPWKADAKVRESLELLAALSAQTIEEITKTTEELVKWMNALEPAYWNGLPTQAMRGTAIVADAPEFPMYWARDLIGKRIAVVWVNLNGVNYGGGHSILDDRDGTGWRKVTEGHGGPRYAHSDVAIAPGSFRLRVDS